MKPAYTKLNHDHLQFFTALLGESNVLVNEEEKQKYGRDYTEDFLFVPEVVLLPQNASEISEILKYCNNQRVAVTPRGAGTGLSGGALPLYGGVVLSTEKLNHILAIDEDNFQVTTEPGVINDELRRAVEAKGLFYPPDPASKGSCFIGGNLAENSGGPKAVKYGVTKDYVLNLEVVLPNGEIMWTGANVLKNSTGYNLTQLLVGSEGTLGVITKVVLKLLGKPKTDLLMMASFGDLVSPCVAVSRLLNAGITPSALEYMERNAVEWSMRYADVSLELENDMQSILLIELDGNDGEILMRECEQIYEILEANKCLNVLLADTAAEKERLWKVRRICGEAVHAHSVYKEEDTVVPRFQLPVLLQKVKEIGAKYGFESVCYGHAGDGNLHVNILKGELDDEAWNHTVKHGIREIFETCHQLGGTISGEHGIGLVQKEYLDVVFNSAQIQLMKGIKQVFDPHGILNPGKIFPD
ncbi:FAD-binding protein [bacterium]|nr:FAD-binding protein [bacterium]